MEQHATFKSSLFGFDKKRVLDYIYAFSQQAKEVEDELNRQIEGLAAARDELCKQLEEAENQFEIVNSKYNAERESSKEAARLIAELGDEIKRQKKIVEEKDRELAIQNERCNQLENKARNMEHKSKKYDELSQQVGDIVLEAQVLAQQIVAKAKERVSLLEQAETKGLPEQETIELRQEVKADLEKMKAGMNEMFTALSSRLEVLETNSKLFGGADSRLSLEVEALKQSSDRMQSDVFALDNRLAQLEAKAAERAQILDVKLDKVAAEAVKAAAVAEKVISLEQGTQRMHTETAALVGRMAEVEAKAEKAASVADKVDILVKNAENVQTEAFALSGRVAEIEAKADMAVAVADKFADLVQTTERLQTESAVIAGRITQVESKAEMAAAVADKIIDLVENSERVQAEANTLVSRVSEIEAKAEKAAAVADRFDELMQNTERMQAETSALVERIAEVEARGDREQAETAEMKEKLSWLEVNTKNVMGTTASINEKVAALENTIKASSQANTLGGRLAELKQQVAQNADSPYKPNPMGPATPGQMPTSTPMGMPMGRPPMPGAAVAPMGASRTFAGASVPPAANTPIPKVGVQDRIDSLLRNKSGN